MSVAFIAIYFWMPIFVFFSETIHATLFRSVLFGILGLSQRAAISDFFK